MNVVGKLEDAKAFLFTLKKESITQAYCSNNYSNHTYYGTFTLSVKSTVF